MQERKKEEMDDVGDDVYIYEGKVNEKVPFEATKVLISPRTRTINLGAFAKCEDLESLTIPSSVLDLGEYSFVGCGFKSFSIPDHITTIGDGLFFQCRQMTSIDIPSCVTTIGDSAFISCERLSSITLPSSLTLIMEKAFCYCRSLPSVDIPSSVTLIEESAFEACLKLSSVSLPSSITSIEPFTFFECESLTSIDLPPSINSIGKFAFGSCDKLQNVYIPPSVKSIGDGAFRKNKSLSKVILPSSDIKFPSGAFDDHTQVLCAYGWANAGPCIMMRDLIESRRADGADNVYDEELEIIQSFIVNVNDDVFRHTLEFVVEYKVAYPSD